jgi:hypothetical protein
MARRTPTITSVRKKIFREVNEHVVEIGCRAMEDEIEILCECGKDLCLAQVTSGRGRRLACHAEPRPLTSRGAG